jgi:hypothetical protein
VGTIVNDDGPLPQMLANISTRGGVLTGNNVMIGGFIIDGTVPKRVLVRSRGPSMAGTPFFVPGTLANPQVQLFSGPTMIAQNDNWQDAPSCPGFVCEGAHRDSQYGLGSVHTQSGPEFISSELRFRSSDPDYLTAWTLYRNCHRSWQFNRGSTGRSI